MFSAPKRLDSSKDAAGAPVYATGVVEQPWESYTPEEHGRWNRLFLRQQKLIREQPLACAEFLPGLEALGLPEGEIPRFSVLSKKLEKLSGWSVVAVEGLLPSAVFFEHLAHRRFPVTWWLRDAQQEDYIVEPDLFHDLFGHLPLLVSPAVADFVQRYGQAVLGLAGNERAQEALAHLYWFTVEFGLTGSPASPRAYGAGILSSFHELKASVLDPAVQRRPADLGAMMTQGYAIDKPQPLYFVIPQLEWLWAWSAPQLQAEALRAIYAPIERALPEGAR